MATFNELTDELVAMLHRGKSVVDRSGAAVGLGRAGGPVAVAALRKAMTEARTGDERAAAAAALGEILGRGHPADLVDPA
ncbi:MAG: hypothetical protein R3260_00640 [Pseudomonas sp.]|nr:hypothetical protein [Pseudomonas sp.]